MESIKTRIFLFTFFGLVSVTILAVFGAILQERIIMDQKRVHEIAEITSDQAILVQRIAFLSERLARSSSGAELSDVKQRYLDAVLSLEASFDELENWIQLNDDKAKSVKAIYARSNIREELRKYVVTARERFDNDSSWQSLRQNASYLARQGRAELSDLTESIRARVLASKQENLADLKWVGIGVLGTILFGVFIVWLFIFRPMFKTILSQQADLQRDRQTLREKNEKLNRSRNELEQAKLDAEAANRAKTEFLANISHEIRTPMTAILGYADIYLSENQTKEERKDTVRIIRKNAKDLMGLIDDILDVSKIEARELKIEKTSISLQKVLSEVHSLLKVKAHHKGIDLRLEFSGFLPRYIHTDPLRLRQILFNIIGNAIKFTKSGYVRVSTEFHQSSCGKALIHFNVDDTGFGIPIDCQSRIFQPFVQLDTSATRQHGGAGLGLALSRDLAILLGGDVELVQSVEGKGSTFRISIDPGPVTQQDLIAYEIKETHDDGDDFKINRSQLLKGFELLVVDDSPDNLALFKVYLQAAGATVHTASDGEEALEIVAQMTFDLILCDLQMPRKDGYQTVQDLRRLGLRIPVLALTAHAMKEEREKCLSLGFDEHVVKPISARKLVNTLLEFLKPNEPLSSPSSPGPVTPGLEVIQ